MASKLNFALKYRPKRMSEYIGNNRIVNSLLATLRNSKPQVIMMTGPSGCGKTTFARLIAQEYLCEDRDEITGACGDCYSCRQMAHFIETGDYGMLPNLKEVDVSDAGKKQDIDMLLEDVEVPSVTGDWKIYILDECHLMSGAAQGRLLKVIEEPPEKVLFILCTTDPDKLLDTIHSRCQNIYEVVKPKRTELLALLKRVATAENFKYDTQGLNLIINKGEFVPRKVLLALESVVAEKGDATYDSVVSVLNVIADQYYFDFFRYLMSEPVALSKYVALIGRVRERVDMPNFVSGLTAFIKKGIYLVNGVMLEELDKSEVELYTSVFKKFKAADLAWLLDFMLNIRNKKDMETKLLLLGYTGINPTIREVVQTSEVACDNKAEIAKESQVSAENSKEMMVMTEEEQGKKIEKLTSSLNFEELADIFGGTVIED